MCIIVREGRKQESNLDDVITQLFGVAPLVIMPVMKGARWHTVEDGNLGHRERVEREKKQK